MANFNFNKVILAGRITKDIDLTKKKGKTYAKFSVAINQKFGDEESTLFMNCVAFKDTAIFLDTYFKKGNSICVEGRLTSSKWVDDEGSKRESFEVIVYNVYFVDSKKEGNTDD